MAKQLLFSHDAESNVKYNMNVLHIRLTKLSQCMRFPTMWYVRPAKPQTSLRIRAV